MSPSVRTVLGGALLLVGALLVGAVTMSVRNNRAFVTVSRDALVSDELLLELEQVLSAVRDAETGQRGFLLTGDAAYLQPYHNGSARVGQHLDNLDRLRRIPAPDGRPRVPEAGTIRGLAGRKLAELQASVDAFDRRRRGPDGPPLRFDAGKALMDSLRQVIGGAERRERAALEEATRQWGERAERSLMGVLALAALGLLLLGLLFWTAMRFHANRLAHDAALAAERDALERRVVERTADLEHERQAALHASQRAEDAAMQAREAAAEAERSAEDAAAAMSRQLAAEAQFHAYVDQVEEYAIFNTDPSGRATSWNAGVERVLGYAEAEFLGLDVSALFPEESRRRGDPEEELAQAAERGTANDDRWMRRKSGEEFYAFGSTTAIHTPDGRLAGFTKVMRDRTEAHLAEVALRKAEREARMFVRLVEESREFIGIATPEGAAFFVNAAGRALVGLADMDAVRRTRVLDYFPAREQTRIAEQVLPLVERQGHWSGETVFRHFGTGEEMPVQWNVFAIPDLQTGRPLAIACVSSDLRERKRGEERLAQAQRMEAIGQLAGGIAHDLNNMLTSILGNATFLQRQLEPSDQRYADAVQIGEAAERSATLTRSLLAFARRDMIQPRLLDLPALLRDMSRMLRPVLGENVELDLRVAPGLPPVFVDRSRMEQVVLNLALNARDAMPQGGIVTIHADSVRVDGEPADLPAREYVRLSVTDTGVGMDETVRTRVFEPFFTTKGIGEGTGLGLAMVYGSITQAGGTVTVESEPGAGATFHVYLPALRDAGPVEGEAAGASTEARGSETVLIVEDEEAVRALAARTLAKAGYTVLEASNGSEALTILARRGEEIELLVTDVVMPGLGGQELAERVWDSSPGLPVLFMSGYSPDDVIRRGLLHQGAAFLQKPFTPDGLAAQVREVLDQAMHKAP
jgi:PAS domain S-box-containing protein